ncbi:MAG: nuclear transport factor 2 family protein [Proteobacteria bacterium]|nr:nuclear transport factor 2 family protein [Pseudomonadota bacterium]
MTCWLAVQKQAGTWPSTRVRRLSVASLLLWLPTVMSACGGGPRAVLAAPGQAQLGRWSALDGSRWLLTGGECADGSPALEARDRLGELRVEARGGGALFVYDQESTGCARTAIDALQRKGRRDDPAGWVLEQQAEIVLPPGAHCGGEQAPLRFADLSLSQGALELHVLGAARCGGLDARLVYHKTGPALLGDEQLIRHYAAHFNRRDAGAIARLLATAASLREPVAAPDSALPRRHDGRAAVRRWHASAFASVPWLALRLLRVDRSAGDGRYLADWHYMDAALSEPLRGRSLFVVAGGEILEAELQFLSTPVPARTRNARRLWPQRRKRRGIQGAAEAKTPSTVTVTLRGANARAQ